MKMYTVSSEDYLKAVLVLRRRIGMVRSVDVARYLDFSRPSVSHAVSVLCEQGLMLMDENNYLHLTREGEAVAQAIYEKFCFFTERLTALGVDDETAEEDACRLEHAISDSAFAKLKASAAASVWTGRRNPAKIPQDDQNCISSRTKQSVRSSDAP